MISLLSAMRILVVILRMLNSLGEVKLKNHFISAVKEYEPVTKSWGRGRYPVFQQITDKSTSVFCQIH